jgi:hypothetical protein
MICIHGERAMRDTDQRTLASHTLASASPPTMFENGSSANWLGILLAGYALATILALAMAWYGVKDAIGYLASIMVLGSFASKSMLPLRVLALLSNLAFIAYAMQRQLHPVLMLHAVLLPINLYYLAQCIGVTARRD